MLKLATLVYVKRLVEGSGGQTLMLHRIKRANDMHQGKWNGLGGKFEPGETPEACAIREVYEESGLTIRRPALRGLLTFPAFRGDEDWYAFVFIATAFSGELIDSAEGVLQWIDDADLLGLPLWEGDRIFLPWLDQERFFSASFVYVEGRYRSHEVVFYPLDDRVAAEAQPAPAMVRHGEAAIAEQQTERQPVHAWRYTPDDDACCRLCGGAVVKHNCKITCTVCGFRRDCSDP
ncbi:MAG: 8-oxo-dGTP diphosphatase [Caldilinea sp.]